MDTVGEKLIHLLIFHHIKARSSIGPEGAKLPYIYIQGCHHMGEGDPTSDILKYNSETVILSVLWIIIVANFYIKHQYLVKNYKSYQLKDKLPLKYQYSFCW